MATELSVSQTLNPLADVLSSSLESLAIQDTPHETDCKIAELRARTLETVRSHIPLTTLFTPELKIDLGKFIKGQMLYRKIAEFLDTLPQTSPVDKDSIAKQFENTSLLGEIKQLFKEEDPTPYLKPLYEACADVLNKKSCSKDLFKSALQDHLCTLQDALKDNKSKEEGSHFIRECLRIHSCSRKVHQNFKAELTHTAEQLIPFVRNITKMYLREHGKDCPDDPLSFRDPSGYNRQGFIAATIMEAGLYALGFSTQVMFRTDLQPKVTLATGHSIVVVTAPDSSRYLVDPCYLQFHKDICLDEASLPTSSVLVLREDEVVAYIEEKLMVHWRQNAEMVKKRDESIVQKLREQDQLITYIIERLNISPELTPGDPEEWVRNALKRVWNLEVYVPIRANRCFQEIFVGHPESQTHAHIEPMGIAALSHYLSDEEVERRLMPFLQDPNLKCQNPPEALSLMALLPTEQRDKYAPLLDLDPRIQDNIGISFNAYGRALRKIVNPQGNDLHVIYGCSGADCISVLLATDAQEFTFVDLTPISYQKFDSALELMKDPLNKEDVYSLLGPYLRGQSKQGAAMSYYTKGQHKMKDLALKFFYNLKCIGVDLNKVVLSSKRGHVCVDFPWQYHGAAFPRNRNVIFVNADITYPPSYPPLLKETLENTDIFYLKAAFFAPLDYPFFLPHIAKSIKPGGWLMTTDTPYSMDKVLPEKCLEQNGLRFALYKSEEKKLLEDLLIQVVDPLGSAPALEAYPPSKRHKRTVSPGPTYWSILNLRKRTA